jgi:hypothetical protein
MLWAGYCSELASCFTEIIFDIPPSESNQPEFTPPKEGAQAALDSSSTLHSLTLAHLLLGVLLTAMTLLVVVIVIALASSHLRPRSLKIASKTDCSAQRDNLAEAGGNFVGNSRAAAGYYPDGDDCSAID